MTIRPAIQARKEIGITGRLNSPASGVKPIRSVTTHTATVESVSCFEALS